MNTSVNKHILPTVMYFQTYKKNEFIDYIHKIQHPVINYLHTDFLQDSKFDSKST